jgi:hypothetical protein
MVLSKICKQITNIVITVLTCIIPEVLHTFAALNLYNTYPIGIPRSQILDVIAIPKWPPAPSSVSPPLSHIGA